MSQIPAHPSSLEPDRVVSLGRSVLQTEIDALARIRDGIGASFLSAVEILLGCRGRVVVSGMGKSGHVGGKLAATLASTGTPAFFVHPGEASHGDIGMVTRDDVVILISNSGETGELTVLLPPIKRLGVPLIAMTGRTDSTLARAAAVVLDVSVPVEACPLGLAPTASTTATLALGDALAVALLTARGFSAEDFALSHPGGALGRRLLLRVEDLLHRGREMPIVTPETRLKDALVEMSAKGFGMTAVVNADERIAGVFTDGDLRRALDSEVDVARTEVATVMTRSCILVPPEMLAAEALKIMEDHRINALLVATGDRRLVGVLNMHDMLAAGVV